MERPTWTRRSFLGACAGGSAALTSAPAWLAGATRPALEKDRVLVIVQLRGGNDGLNTVIPREDALYYNARPDLAIPAKEALPLDDLHGFHPSLRAIARRYAEGQIGIQRGVGYKGTNLSHFRSMDIWDSAAWTCPYRIVDGSDRGRTSTSPKTPRRSPCSRSAGTSFPVR